ncbi:CAAX amino terminal protease family protein [Leptotrichia sp. oral taxon 215 str. W9775]|uniref:CPBP family intramembrane glutamic endopeptidase n=1 Tax=Leptotrichia sp. oral taxon 215 TaxID=712359 RepID=UPI0003ADF0B3|nr:CPBP family intramembrane glutamic endopeptidase [Leptotrichia sp. oral taxon 215]ERK68989.1 CAAX amino terminal protease family protein [Leptotrichia sp. oral taxon 215 str. W9775]
MQKSLIKDNTKKDVPLILCIIYFSYLIFKIFIQKEITGTDNSILKTMYFFRMDKLLFCVPILYYFIKTNKEKKYFKVNKKLNITDIVTYFALSYGINIFLNLISSAINIEGQKFIVQRPIYTDIIYAICIAPVLEEIVFRGVLMTYLKKYGIQTAIIVSSLFFGISHYNIYMIIPAFFIGIVLAYVSYKYSIKYSILLHILLNIVANMSKIVFVLKGPKEIFPLLGIIFISLFVLCLIFFIIGLKRKNYQDVFLAFKLNNEDRKNMVIFLKNNILYIVIIFGIVITSLLFNYKLF